VWLVLELCSGGNLQDSFRQRNDAFNMPRLLCRLAEVAQGMAYLHSKNICHGVSQGSAAAAAAGVTAAAAAAAVAAAVAAAGSGD
jgi:hypothetical protein